MNILGHHGQDEYSRIYGSSKRDIRDDLGWRVYDPSYYGMGFYFCPFFHPREKHALL